MSMSLKLLAPVRAPDDLLLAQRCVAGDRAAQRELFRAHRQRVQATLYRMVGSNAHMDDLVQDAFLNVFRSLKNYRGEASLGTWIDRCTVRVAYAFFGEKRAQPPQLELVSDVPAGDASAEQRVLAREAARRLYAELEKMDAPQRVAFTLHAIDGRPLAEVAVLTESSLEATKTRVFRARQALEKRARKDPSLAAFVSSASQATPGPNEEERGEHGDEQR
jgi:RNA polymerase sigma-70 factor (ECF subfamily)